MDLDKSLCIYEVETREAAKYEEIFSADESQLTRNCFQLQGHGPGRIPLLGHHSRLRVSRPPGSQLLRQHLDLLPGRQQV